MKKLLFILTVLSILFGACTKDDETKKAEPKGVIDPIDDPVDPPVDDDDDVPPVDPTLCIDASGKEYKTLVIGQQRWMAENYAYLPTVCSYDDYSVDEPRSYVYSYEGTDVTEAKEEYNYGRFGVLYNYQAAMDYCPVGWHLPTDDEWKVLEIYLGMTPEDAEMVGITDGNSNSRGDIEIMKKFVSKTYGGTNESGLDMLFGGSCDSKGFCLVMQSVNYWTATVDTDEKAWFRGFALMPGIYRGPNFRTSGLSVRYIKD
jgi:uncharacterized protein (TIGR02145 family)